MTNEMQPARHWTLAIAAILAAMVFNAISGDLLESMGLRDALRGIPYAFSVLANTVDLVFLVLAFWLIAGVSLGRQWQIVGLAKPLLAPLAFAAILFVPACAAAWAIAGPAETIEARELAFGGVIFPVYEEVIFRGLAIGVLMVHFRLPFLIAALLPSLFFGALHMYQSDALTESLTIAAITAFGSFWFGWVYWKWGFNLWPAILLHVGLNSAWTIFALGENALGGQLGNIIRIAVIAGSIMLTIWGQDRLRRFVKEPQAA